MTLQTRLAAKLAGGGSIFRRREAERESYKTNGADMFLGAIVTNQGEANPYDIDLCDYDENPDGVIECLSNDATVLNDNDAEGLIATNINVEVVNPDNNDEFLTVLGLGRSCSKKDILVIDDQYPGFVEPIDPDDESIAQVPPFRIIGEALETVTGVAQQNAYVWTKRRS